MASKFGDTLRNLRVERGLSQQQLASKLFVDRSTVARWETGTRLPDAPLMARIAAALGVGAADLLDAAAQSGERPEVIVVDDERIVLHGTMGVVCSALPGAAVTGFDRASEALAFARARHVSLAFLDIELGRMSGLDLCRRLLEVSSSTNVVFLTAYPDYALEAWETGACGFLLKPVTEEALRERAAHLRFPVPGLVRP